MSTHQDRSRGKPRSVEQHRRFFGVIRAAYHHWPERCNFQPDNEDHLRAWLLVKAKHRSIKMFQTEGDASSVAALLPIVILMMTKKYAWSWAVPGGVQVCMAESISFDNLAHAPFCALNDDVDEVIRVETGLDPEALLREKSA